MSTARISAVPSTKIVIDARKSAGPISHLVLSLVRIAAIDFLENLLYAGPEFRRIKNGTGHFRARFGILHEHTGVFYAEKFLHCHSQLYQLQYDAVRRC